MIKHVIPVKHLGSVAKADEALKVLVMRFASKGRRSLAGGLADAIVESVTAQVKDAEVKNLDVSRMVIASGAQQSWPSPYNDPDSDLFVAQDEMPTIFEALIACDAVVVATDTNWNFPNRHLVGMAERLMSFKTGIESGQVKYGHKALAIIATSVYGGANQVAGDIAQMFSHLGFTVPGYCVITAMENTTAKEDFSAATQAAGVALVDAALAFRRS